MPIQTALNRRTLLKLTALAGSAMALPAAAALPTAPAASDGAHWLIRHATVLSMDPQIGELSDADIELRDGVIVAVGKGLMAPGAQLLEASGMIVIPGLVDTHWHLWNSLLRNSAPAPAGEPFFKSQLATSKRFTADLSALGVRLGLAEAVNAGITTFNNWAHNLRDASFAHAELRALQDSGVRGRFWYGYAQDLAPTAPMDFADIQRVQQQLQAAGQRFDLGLAIRGPERTEAPIWTAEFAFAKAQGLPVSTHIAVTQAMQQKRAVQQLAQRGLLDRHVQLVHATHVNAQDIDSIARSGASVCLTPLTEMRVGYGLAPVNALHAAKIPISVGIDTLVLSGNANPFMLMQTLLNLASGMSGNEQALTARDVLHWATQGGAEAMGLGTKIGSITPGKRADLVLIDTRGIGMSPVIDPFASVVQSASAAQVDTVFADGRLLKRNGTLLNVDTRRLGEEVTEAVARLLSPA